MISVEACSEKHEKARKMKLTANPPKIIHLKKCWPGSVLLCRFLVRHLSPVQLEWPWSIQKFFVTAEGVAVVEGR